MSNKIDAYNTASPVRTTAAAVKPAAAAGASATQAKIAPAAESDTVQLTGDARRLQELEKNIAAIPQVDHARVQRVRDALDKGTYKIDSQAIAGKLARAEWEFQGLASRS